MRSPERILHSGAKSINRRMVLTTRSQCEHIGARSWTELKTQILREIAGADGQ